MRRLKNKSRRTRLNYRLHGEIFTAKNVAIPGEDEAESGFPDYPINPSEPIPASKRNSADI
jgi:hypothetical protein